MSVCFGVLQVAAGEGNLFAFGYRERLGLIRRLCLFLFVLHGADSQTLVAFVVLPFHLLMLKSYYPNVIRGVLEKRRRPIVATISCDVGGSITVAKPRSGKEDGVTIRLACYLVAVHAVLCSPRPRTLFTQLRPFGIGGHTPYIAPIGSSGIVFRLQDCLIVNEAVVATTCISAVLGEFMVVKFPHIGIFVGRPRVVLFAIRLAPSEIVTIAFGRGGTDVA